MSIKYIQSGKLLLIKNIRDKLMGIHNLTNGDSIEFLWVDKSFEEESDPQYRIGFNYMGIEYSAYLHTMPMYNQHDHYRMNLYGPAMNGNTFYFHYNDFVSHNVFIYSLIRQLDRVC